MGKIVQIQDVKPDTWIFFKGNLMYLKEKNRWHDAVCYHRKQRVVLWPWTNVTVAAVSDKVTTEGWV